MSDSDTAGTTDTTSPSAESAAVTTPLLRMLQLPGLAGVDGEVPVCGPDGCAVPTAAPTTA